MTTSVAYPVHVNAALDPKSSRWLWLVKWVLVIPHYIVVGVFVGGGAWAANGSDNWQWNIGGSGGLVGILVIIAAVILAFTGAYPRPLYDLILGMNRWALRVAGYAALMTDVYPPFRLDQGGSDSTLAVPFPSGGAPGSSGTTMPEQQG